MLTNQDKLKYSRQIMLNDFGEAGQLALQQAKVLIVGLGGLGNPCAQYLAAAGVGTLYLADGDAIEISNLPRQFLFSEEDMKQNKAETAQNKLTAQYPDITIESIDEMLDEELAQYYAEQVDVIIDCTDNIEARYLLNNVCLQTQTPLIIGAATGLSGQCLVINPQKVSSPCYQCLFPESEKKPQQNCSTMGILSPVLMMIAGMQNLQALKLLIGKEAALNRFFMFDGLDCSWQEFSLNKNPNCLACST